MTIRPVYVAPVGRERGSREPLSWFARKGLVTPPGWLSWRSPLGHVIGQYVLWALGPWPLFNPEVTGSGTGEASRSVFFNAPDNGAPSSPCHRLRGWAWPFLNIPGGIVSQGGVRILPRIQNPLKYTAKLRVCQAVCYIIAGSVLESIGKSDVERFTRWWYEGTKSRRKPPSLGEQGQ
jgi:hypothetical protein